MMISALKITLARIADCGEWSRMMLSALSAGYVAMNIAGMIAKYLATSLAIENVVSAPARHQELLPDLDDLDQLGRIRVEVHHVAGLARRLRAGVHRHAHVGLRQRGSVVGPVARHRDQPAAGLLPPDERQLVFRPGLGQEVVDAGLLRDRRRGERIVAGDHHGANAHRAQAVEALAHAALHDVLEIHGAEHPRAPVVPLGHHQRRAAGPGDPLDDARPISSGTRPLPSRTQPAIASPAPFRSLIVSHVHATHAGGRARRARTTSGRASARLRDRAAAKSNISFASTTMLRPSGRLVGQRGELRPVGQLLGRHARAPA